MLPPDSAWPVQKPGGAVAYPTFVKHIVEQTVLHSGHHEA